VVGGVLLGKKEKLASAIRVRISEEDLEGLRPELAGRLVDITFVFSLNRGFPPFSRPHKKCQLISGIRLQGLLQPQQSLLGGFGVRSDGRLCGDFLLGECLNH
jgi:hypothetical protein